MIKANKDDVIKTAVLQFFYDKYEEKPNIWIYPEKVSSELSFIPEKKVLAAIEFLFDENFLKKSQKGEAYKISSKGIQYISPSLYGPQTISSLSISSKGGVFVLGDNLGTIKYQTVQSFEEITKLIKEITKSNLDDKKKRDLIGDAETIKAQMTKQHPDKSIIQKAWDSLSNISSILEVANILKTIADMIGPYIK